MSARQGGLLREFLKMTVFCPIPLRQVVIIRLVGIAFANRQGIEIGRLGIGRRIQSAMNNAT